MGARAPGQAVGGTGGTLPALSGLLIITCTPKISRVPECQGSSQLALCTLDGKKRGMWVKKSGNVELRSLSPKRCPVVGACLPQRPCSPGRWAAVLFHGGDAKEQLVYYFYQIFNTVPEAPASNSQLLLSRKKSTESKPPSCSERPLTLFHTAQPNEKRECPPGPAALP